MTSSVATVIDDLAKAWNALDVAALEALWSNDEPEIYYLAEEIDAPLRSIAAVRDYWQHTAAIVDAVRMTTDDLRFRQLTKELVVATYALHVDMRLRGTPPGEPIGVDAQVAAILRRTDDGWRFIHYSEAPLGALPFVRRAYRANVLGPL